MIIHVKNNKKILLTLWNHMVPYKPALPKGQICNEQLINFLKILKGSVLWITDLYYTNRNYYTSERQNT